MTISPRPNPATVSALLDTTWRVAAAEGARTSDLDRKAISVTTFAGLVLSLTAALGGRNVAAFDRWWMVVPYLGGLAALVSAAALGARVLLPKETETLAMAYLDRFPNWSEILKPPETVQGETMAGLIEAVAKERSINRLKAHDVRRAFLFLLGGLALVLIEGVTLVVVEVAR